MQHFKICFKNVINTFKNFSKLNLKNNWIYGTEQCFEEFVVGITKITEKDF